LLLLFVSGCQSLGYYAQSARGQWQMVHSARPIDQWLADDSTPDELRIRLELVRQIREFASIQLHLPDNNSYTLYADLERAYAVWTVFAAPELSLNAYLWCYPVVGCQAYRGYFDKQAALDLAAGLKVRGFDTVTGGVKAYSTLGWFDDPVLNTFIEYSDTDLAGLIFHELAHQVVYIKDDTVFNESFATLVENRGVEAWLADTAPAGLEAFEQSRQYDEQVISLILNAKSALESLYQSGLSEQEKRAQKARVFAGLKQGYQAIKQAYPENTSWDRWFSRELNNAHLIAVGAYFDQVRGFNVLFERSGSDFEIFFGKVKQLARLDKDERDEVLLIPGIDP